MDGTISIDFVDQLKASQSDNVTIYVGKRQPDSDPYVVPKVVLANTAPYFNKMINSDFVEGQSGVLHFPEDDQDSWVLFLYWLFNRELPEPPKAPPREPCHMAPAALGPFMSALIRAWVLGDKYDVPAFQNSCTHRMMRLFELTFPSVDSVIDTFTITPSHCPLRKLIVEELVVAVMKMRLVIYQDLEQFARFEGFFPLWIQAQQEFATRPRFYPIHDYGRNEREMRKYLVEEDPEFESEVTAILKEHGQA